MKPKIASNHDVSQYIFTCSADKPEDYCVTYATSMKYLQSIAKSGKQVAILMPDISDFQNISMMPDRITMILVDNPEHEFILYHNWINSGVDPKKHEISEYARIHPDARIGPDGMRYIKESNTLISMKHMGNVVIGANVEIGPFSTIARATLDSTVIKDQARIGHGVYIGHNCRVGKRTIIVDGAIMGGSSEVGDDCWIGLNATIRNGVKICDNTMIAMGAVLAKNIDTPGIYVGAPAKRMGDWDGSW